MVEDERDAQPQQERQDKDNTDKDWPVPANGRESLGNADLITTGEKPDDEPE